MTGNDGGERPVTEAPTLEELRTRALASGPRYGADAQIVCDNLVRIYRGDGVEVVALQGLDLLVEAGELMALVGASGSGKSTLLNILSGLDLPTAGGVRVAGLDLVTMSARERLRYRREVVGFVWQRAADNLLPYLSAADNVELPMRLAGSGRRRRRTGTAELLDLLGVADCARSRPGELSGGQQQRVSMAVALAGDPKVVLADEPTGELDSESAGEVFQALRTVNRELGTTVLVVTHDEAVSSAVDRTVAIRDGRAGSEVLRRADADGAHTHEEFAVLDRAGRLQLPREFLTELDMADRVRLALEQDHIGVWPDRNGAEGTGGDEGGGGTSSGDAGDGDERNGDAGSGDERNGSAGGGVEGGGGSER